MIKEEPQRAPPSCRATVPLSRRCPAGARPTVLRELRGCSRDRFHPPSARRERLQALHRKRTKDKN